MQPALAAPTEEKESLRPRGRLPLSFIIGGLAILAAVMYLVYANTQANAVYYMTVSEMKNCTTCMTQSVRVAGVVQQGSVVRDDQKQLVSFTITQVGQQLAVMYNGVVPDIFRPGIEVVVEGHYTGHGPFQAQNLLAKCPSKFQAATPTP